MKNSNQPSAADLRDAILKRMGPTQGPFYADGVAAMLDAYVAKLKENWERGERQQVEDRFLSAVRRALDEHRPA